MCGSITSLSNLITQKTIIVVGNLVFITLSMSFGHIAIHLYSFVCWAWFWQKYFISKKPQHVGLLWVLQLVEKFSGLKHPSVLNCLGQNLTSFHSVTFPVQIFFYTTLSCLFINLRFRSHGSHGLE